MVTALIDIMPIARCGLCLGRGQCHNQVRTLAHLHCHVFTQTLCMIRPISTTEHDNAAPPRTDAQVQPQTACEQTEEATPNMLPRCAFVSYGSTRNGR